MPDTDPKALRYTCERLENDGHSYATVPVATVLALLDRLEAAERTATALGDARNDLVRRAEAAESQRDALRDDAQRIVDGWRADADRARATGLTIEAVRGLVEAWDRTDISFSRMVEDLRTLAMVRAETAERELAEVRAKLPVDGSHMPSIVDTLEDDVARLTKERDEARAALAELSISNRDHYYARTCTCPACLVDRRDELEEAARQAEKVLSLATARTFPAPEDAEVRRLGERIGFGALMSAAEKTWREWLAEQDMPLGSEFVAGPCRVTVERSIAALRAALKGGA